MNETIQQKHAFLQHAQIFVIVYKKRIRPGTVTLSFTVLPFSKIDEANSHFSFFIFFHFLTKKMYSIAQAVS